MASLPDHLKSAPVGKERLPKQVLEEHQRDRVLAAAIDVFAESGYTATTVDDLVEAAQIGVGTFYSLIGGKEECFLRLYDRLVADAEERVAMAAAGGGDWAASARAGLRAVLEIAAESPNRARVVVVESRTAGPEGEARYAATVDRIVAALRRGRRRGPEGDNLSPSFEPAAVAGLAWLLHRRLTDDEPIDVDSLLPDMERIAIDPYGA